MTRLHVNGLVRRTGPREWATSDPRVAWALGGSRAEELTQLAHPFPSMPLAPPNTDETIVSIGRPWSELTTRQRRILEQLANGHTNAEIADTLGLSLSTVKGHLRNAYRQLGVHNRRDAVTLLNTETGATTK